MTLWQGWGVAITQSMRRLSHTVATFPFARTRIKKKDTHIYMHKGAMGVVATVRDSEITLAPNSSPGVRS